MRACTAKLNKTREGTVTVTMQLPTQLPTFSLCNTAGVGPVDPLRIRGRECGVENDRIRGFHGKAQGRKGTVTWPPYDTNTMSS